MPNRAEVFLVATSSDWCESGGNLIQPSRSIGGREPLLASVRAAFGAGVVLHAALISEPNSSAIALRVQAAAARSGHARDASKHKIRQMETWHAQFAKVAAAEALRRASTSAAWHEVIVRIRIDLPLPRRLPLHPFSRELDEGAHLVWGIGGITGTLGYSGSPLQPIIHDWLYLAGPAGMALLAAMTDVVLHEHKARCFGFCPEEQVQLQLLHAGFELRPFARAGPGFAPLRIHKDVATCKPIMVSSSVRNSTNCKPTMCVPAPHVVRKQAQRLYAGTGGHSQGHRSRWRESLRF
eukprot:CAMPEP_0119331514 /NCGR_PEP_ID=MMETSP1333-20130426/80720_1 /TAXON_ID=418940 /ORGANISM="Scyphosphaera apsteinii, Strain RCC1455" /LENGTH=294 /DNA_ID=CAMNT_0007341131 /DNA_START=478 /DNA_END=1362 /DNA_ORIENTATION=+